MTDVVLLSRSSPVWKAIKLVSQLGQIIRFPLYDHIFLTYYFFELSQSLGSVTRVYLEP